jgi:hypothetical protein
MIASVSNSELKRTNAYSVLHHGEPVGFQDTLIVPVENLKSSGDILDVGLTFGSKNSPLRASMYKLAISNPVKSLCGDDLVTDRKEGVLYSDIQDAAGYTRENILERKLGRIPNTKATWN